MSNRDRQKIKQMRADGTADRKTVPTRINCSHLVGVNGPTCALWTATPEIQVAGAKLAEAGTTLENAESTVQLIQSQLATAINVRDGKVVDFDAVHGVYVAIVESYATSPQDITGLGLTVFARASHALVAPLGIEATFDAEKGKIQIRVNRAPGLQACVVEVSSNPADPASWQRLPGFGVRHKLDDYAPGTYWVRAASARASKISDFTAPVAVIVK